MKFPRPLDGRRTFLRGLLSASAIALAAATAPTAWIQTSSRPATA